SFCRKASQARPAAVSSSLARSPSAAAAAACSAAWASISVWRRARVRSRRSFGISSPVALASLKSWLLSTVCAFAGTDLSGFAPCRVGGGRQGGGGGAVDRAGQVLVGPGGALGLLRVEENAAQVAQLPQGLAQLDQQGVHVGGCAGGGDVPTQAGDLAQLGGDRGGLRLLRGPRVGGRLLRGREILLRLVLAGLAQSPLGLEVLLQGGHGSLSFRWASDVPAGIPGNAFPDFSYSRRMARRKWSRVIGPPSAAARNAAATAALRMVPPVTG